MLVKALIKFCQTDLLAYSPLQELGKQDAQRSEVIMEDLNKV